MNYLIDTNVASEITKPQRNAQVLRWYGSQPPDTLFISALTLGELRKGILQMDEGRRRRGLSHWLENVLEPSFDGRVVTVDAVVARTWAELQSRCRQRGRLLPLMDSLIAASALAHGLTIATRNVVDFKAMGAPLLNPWEA